MIQDLLSENPDDFRTLNAVENLYLKELFRFEEALVYFQKSLGINKNQPEIARLVDYLRKRGTLPINGFGRSL